MHKPGQTTKHILETVKYILFRNLVKGEAETHFEPSMPLLDGKAIEPVEIQCCKVVIDGLCSSYLHNAAVFTEQELF